MMRRNLIKSLLVLALPVVLPMQIEAELKHDMEFSESALSLSGDTVENMVYTVVDYSGLSVSGEPGEPALPVMDIRFSVPCLAKDFEVTVTENTGVTLPVNHPILPVQQPVRADFSAPPAFEQPDAEIYGADAGYPEAIGKVVGEGYYDGDNHIVTVAVSPISYNPVQGALRLHTSVTVSLSYSIANSVAELSMRPISRFQKSQSGMESVKSIVVNPAQVEKFVPVALGSIKPMTVVGVPAYEYCVITSRELAPAFDRLVYWKRQKGYFAGVVCMEDILACPDFQLGDEVSGINDDAGKLRAYLKYSYSGDGSGKYVLLAGDYSVLPIRYGRSIDNAMDIDDIIPSDLYFSDLNGNWDADKNGLYGEPSDKVDFNCELLVGRLICSTEEEVFNYTDKLLQYEQNPGNGDASYLKKAFYSQCDDMLYYKQANQMAEAFNSIFDDQTIFSEEPSYNDENPTFPTGSQCIEEMNNNYGFLGWYGHGQPGGVCVKSRNNNREEWYAILALENNVFNHKKENGNGLDNLKNAGYPAVAFSSSCSLAPFDDYNLENCKKYGYDLNYSIGSSFTVGGSYGGPIFLGNSRPAYIVSSFSLQKAIAEYIDSDDSYRFSECMSIAKLKESGIAYQDKLTLNLIGCPELEMWTDIPFEYDPKAITITRTDGTVTVGGVELQGSKVAFNPGWNYCPEIVECSGTKITSPKADPNAVVTVYRHNAIPYVLPVVWQNGEVRSKQYYFTNDVTIGCDVDSGRTKGDYVFTKDADVTIESKGDISINDGFKMETGSVVTIKTTGNVIISGGTMESGANLSITAPSISVLKNFSAEKGAMLNLNYE